MRHCLALALSLLAAVLAGPGSQVRADTPIDVVLMLDNSGSMRENDPSFLTAVAVRQFLERLSGDVRVGILAFDQRTRWIVPLMALDDTSRPSFLNGLDVIDYRGQFTDSPKAMERAIYDLKVNGRLEAEKVIVFMTDGIVDTGDKARHLDKARWMQEDLAAEAADAEIRIYGIAFTDNADFQLIQAVSRRTGGEYYRAYTAADIDKVFERIFSVLDLAEAIEFAPSETESETPLPSPESSEFAESAMAESPVTEPEPEPEPESAEESESRTEPESTASLAAISQPETLDSATLTADDSDDSTRVESADESEASSTLAPTHGGISDALSVTSDANEAVGTLAGIAASDGKAPEPAAPASLSIAVEASTEPEAAPIARDGGTESSEGRESTATADLGAQAATDTSSIGPRWIGVAGAIVVALIGVAVFVYRRGRSDKGSAKYLPKAYLNDLAGATDKRSYELSDALTVVGRLKATDNTAANYIVINETTIGRRHAMVEFKDHSFWVTDQGSLNGTFVNNERIEGPHQLKHGDRIRFHRHEFEFLMLDMFETDRTMLSETMLADFSTDNDEDVTQERGPSGHTTTNI